MKLIAFYLPQFHEIPENNEWWGKGFTEWTNVKKATQINKEQYQPRIPLNNNYYNLIDPKTQEWQSELALKYGIFGFCYYHYWFDGHMLLEKPMENMLKNKNIRIPFCICWANEDWTNAWVSSDAKVLITQTYGNEEEWERHYRYLSQFFHDERYICENNKPLIIIYRPEIIPCIREMLSFWNELAISDGFDGLTTAYQAAGLDYPNIKDSSFFDYDIEYQPIYGTIVANNQKSLQIKGRLLKIIQKLHMDWIISKKNDAIGPRIRDYDSIWKKILSTPPVQDKSIPCAFVDFDNTPRRNRQGWFFSNVTVNKFKEYFGQYVKKAQTQYNNDYMFIFAWNEWAEGGYLEPDEKNRYGYLEAIYEILNQKDEKNDK